MPAPRNDKGSPHAYGINVTRYDENETKILDRCRLHQRKPGSWGHTDQPDAAFSVVADARKGFDTVLAVATVRAR